MPDPDALLSDYGDRNGRLIKFWLRSGFVGEGSTVLDFGAGTGHVLRSLKHSVPSLQISCIEANAAASLFLRSQSFSVFESLAEAPLGSFDAIILIELLEHLNDPVSVLAEIKLRLRKGGKIFISTPCGETRSGFRETSAYNTPEHVQFWTENSFQLLCRKTGFTFHPAPQRIMCPRKHYFDRWTFELLRMGRDSLMGIRYLVGFLESGPAN